MFTDINSEDRLVQKTVADHLRDKLGWERFYAWNDETFGPAGMLGRDSVRDAVLRRDLCTAITRLNPDLPESARNEAFQKLIRVDYARSLLPHNREFYCYIRNGVPVTWRDPNGETQHGRARVIDFRNVANNRFVAVRELKLQGLRVVDALNVAENHLRSLGFDPAKLTGAKRFARISALRDATNALYTSDEAKRRFEIMAREVFARFKALLMEPSVFAYAERHDNIEAIYKKLEERRDTADVTELLKELHRIVNEAIRAAGPGEDHTERLTVDLSQIDFERLRKEFAKAPRKNATLHDIREVVEKKLAQMLNNNPARMDYYRRYQEIIADYNREKDRTNVEQTFAALVALVESLDAEQHRALAEGLTEKELALFDMLSRENLSKADRERLKQASKLLLARLQELLTPMGHWTRNAQTQADVEASILDWLYESLPRPPFTEQETVSLAQRVYDFVWQQSESGSLFAA